MTTAEAVAVERPILFSAPMVRAILEGCKTQTRRVLKGFKITGPNPPNASTFDVYDADNPKHWLGAFGTDGTGNATQLCPYGRSGDRLWVRETWKPSASPLRVRYRADFSEGQIREMQEFRLHWRPSIFMPRQFSRITLEITRLRVQRVREIANEDAFAEGCDFPVSNTPNHANAFALLWDSINLKRGYGWHTNPWVWVLEFKRVNA